jgi:hypothetical protein
LYPRRSREELEGGSWVQWLTRIRKVNGTTACQQSDGHAQVSGVRRRGTRVIWRKLDCLNPNLQTTQRSVRRKDTRNRRHALRRGDTKPDAPSGRGALPSEGNQGDEWDAYVTLDTYDRDEHGINPPGASLGGDGVPIVVVGATTHQGGRESRPQGEGAQVAGCPTIARYA